MVHSKLSRHIEKRAGVDIANVRCLPEDHDLDVDDDVDSDSNSNDSSNISSYDDGRRSIDVDDPRPGV